MTTYRPGDQVTATLDDTDGRTVTAVLTVNRVDQLGCGCTRLTADRPGTTPRRNGVQLLSGCAAHASEVQDAADTKPCGPCHGTGTRYDATCAGNVYTDGQTISRCEHCKGAGRRSVESPESWVRPDWYDDETGAMPAWMLGDEQAAA